MMHVKEEEDIAVRVMFVALLKGLIVESKPKSCLTLITVEIFK